MTSWRRAGLSVLAALAGCSPEGRTQVLLVVDAEPGVRDAASHLELRVLAAPRARDDWREVRAQTVGPADGLAWPVSLALIPEGGDASRRYDVRASARDGADGDVVAQARVVSGYVAGQTRMVRVVLEDACLRAGCQLDETCRGGVCGPPLEIDPDTLPPVGDAGAGPGRPDAAVDPGADGGAAPDAARDAGADAAAPCDPSRCVWGRCAGSRCDDPVQIAAGSFHTCALRAGGTVVCWGHNGDGQVGDGTTADQPRPVTVPGLTDAVEIAAGYFHTCARHVTNEVSCWGAGDRGQLGNGGTASLTAPRPVTGLADAIGLAAGWFHTCAVHASRSVACWGQNAHRQLGDVGAADRRTPVDVPGLDDVRSVEGGRDHTCARRGEAGTVVCWGRNTQGQLGDGTTTPDVRGTPDPALGPVDATDVATGGHHTCAVTGRAVFCWGFNFHGQLGDGSTENRSTPAAIADLSMVSAIDAGQAHTCAVRDGAVWCWGLNANGQIGDGTTEPRPSPTPAMLAERAVEVVAGDSHTCARTAAGAIFCWGGNAAGQLGDGTTDGHSLPIAVVAPGAP